MERVICRPLFWEAMSPKFGCCQVLSVIILVETSKENKVDRAAMTDRTSQMQLLRQVFSVLREKLISRQQSVPEPGRQGDSLTTLSFQIGHHYWLFTKTEETILLEEKLLDGVASNRTVTACHVSTDTTTMLNVCRGELSFLTAYLSGKVKVVGDQKILKAMNVPIKDAIDEVRRRNAQAEQQPHVVQPPSTMSAVQPQAPIVLKVKIVEAVGSSFTYNVNDKASKQISGAANSKDSTVRYKVEVALDGTEETWTVLHRYSSFLQLRSELVEQGYTSLPAITSRSSLFNSIDRVIHSRIVKLGVFLSECVAVVGPENATLNQFLAKPVHRVHSTDRAAAAASDVSFTSGADQHQPEDRGDADDATGTDYPPLSAHDKHVAEALEHAWSRPITWAHQDLHHSRYLIRELGAQQKAIDRLTQQDPHHTATRITNGVVAAAHWLFCLICGAIVGYAYACSVLGAPQHPLANLSCACVLALFLLVPLTRLACVKYCIGWLCLLHGLHSASVLANEVFDAFMEHWTAYRNHLKWVAIPHGVVVAPEHYRLPPSLLELLRVHVPRAVYQATVGSLAALGQWVVTYVDKVTLLAQKPVEVHVSSLQELLFHLDVPTCVIVGLFVIVLVVLRSPGLSRALWIYSLGVSLITIYATLQLSCLILRVRPATSEALFAQLDSVIAPIVVVQIGLLRSVFVKFAQYFGGRSDVVSPIWTNLLTQLHDSCPPSRQEYVRKTVEDELGAALQQLEGHSSGPDGTGSATAAFKLEDVFDSFDLQPLASASIGQVHVATIKHAALMRILNLQQQRQRRAQQSTPSAPSAAQGQPASASEQVRSPDQTTEEGSDDAVDSAVQSPQRPTGDPRGDVSSSPGSYLASPVPAPPLLSSTSTPIAERSHSHHTLRGGAKEAAHSDGTDGSSSWYEPNTDAAFTCALPSEASQLVQVVVKVQHEGVAALMLADMGIVLTLIKWASLIDSRWETMLQVMRSWDLTMRGELDYREEAGNLREMRDIMERSGLGAATPYPVPGLESSKVLVMTRLFGHKVTDKAALLLHNVDREALLWRIAHCSAYQLLVAGVFNADPHAGNILFCLSTAQPHLPGPVRMAPHLSPATSFTGSIRSLRGRPRAPSDTASDTGSIASLLPGNNDSNGSLLDLVADRGNQSVEKEGTVRHHYDATPAKGVTFAPTPERSSEAGTAPSTAAHASEGEPAPKLDAAARKFIYDATPAKGVGFAMDVSAHSAEPLTPTPSSRSATPNSAAAGRAGHTPFFPAPRSASSFRLPPSGRRVGHLTPLAGSELDLTFTSETAAPEVPQIIPGLLDFGMTVRLNRERRRTYCRLIIALCDGDLKTAAAELRSVGYSSNQSDRVPERDAEFFEHLFRDANPRGVSKEERQSFEGLRAQQKAADIAAGTREPGGRSIATVPDDFLFLTRLVGLLRGLCSELDCSCPILYILALNAKVGLLEDADEM